MLEYSGANLLTHGVSFAWTFRASIVRVRLDSSRVLSLTVSLRKAHVDGVSDGGRLYNLALPLALPYIVEYLCSCVVSPARNMTTHAVPT